MFDSVMGRAQTAKNRFGTGTFISLALHGGLLAGALWISGAHTGPTVSDKPDFPTVVFPKGTPNGGGPKTEARPTTQARAQPRPQRKTHAIAQPKDLDKIDTKKVDETPPDAQVSTNPEVVASAATGPTTGEAIGPGGGGGEGPLGRPDGTGQLTQEIPFGAGMDRPVLLSGKDPEYNRDALMAHVEGTMLVRCVITPEGTLERCRTLKSLPFMEEAVLASLATRHYKPVTYQGQAVPVSYTFTIRLMLPGR